MKHEIEISTSVCVYVFVNWTVNKKQEFIKTFLKYQTQKIALKLITLYLSVLKVINRILTKSKTKYKLKNLKML